jgi:transposase
VAVVASKILSAKSRLLRIPRDRYSVVVLDLAELTFAKGVPRKLLARILGVSPASLSRWAKLADTGMLTAKPHPRRPRKLSDDDCRELEQLLLKGATSYGWLNNLWTAGRVCRLIYDNFGVKYHPAHVTRILRVRLNWTCQRPVNHHEDRDDKAIQK